MSMTAKPAREYRMLENAFRHVSDRVLNLRDALDGAPGFCLALAILAAIAGADYVTGLEVSFLVFYLIPVCVAAWFCGLAPGLGVSFLTTVTWEVVNRNAGLQYSSAWADVWNTASRFAFYAMVAYLFVLNRRAHTQLAWLSDTDALTGLANRRKFARRLEAEIERQKRTGRPLSLAFLDIDHFKALNDEHGHEAGDAALRVVAAILREKLQQTHIPARIGGDEFAIILPEIDGADAEILLAAIQDSLLRAMREKAWKLTFSIGLAHGIADIGADAWLHAADEAMYSVKRQGRNAINFRPIAHPTAKPSHSPGPSLDPETGAWLGR
jgi:diguanylate cyclase (GGDEF)-like protein